MRSVAGAGDVFAPLGSTGEGAGLAAAAGACEGEPTGAGGAARSAARGDIVALAGYV